MGVDQETLITPIPTFPHQGGRRLRVRDPLAKRTSLEGEGFPPSPTGTLNRRLDQWSGGRGSAFKVYSEENDTDSEAKGYLKYLSPS